MFTGDDYKYAIQMRAEDMAADEFDSDFYSLPPAVQDRLYNQAMGNWREDALSRADDARKRSRES